VTIRAVVDGHTGEAGGADQSLIDSEGEIKITLPEIVHVDSNAVAQALVGT